MSKIVQVWIGSRSELYHLDAEPVMEVADRLGVDWSDPNQILDLAIACWVRRRVTRETGAFGKEDHPLTLREVTHFEYHCTEVKEGRNGFIEGRASDTPVGCKVSINTPW